MRFSSGRSLVQATACRLSLRSSWLATAAAPAARALPPAARSRAAVQHVKAAGRA